MEEKLIDLKLKLAELALIYCEKHTGGSNAAEHRAHTDIVFLAEVIKVLQK